MRERDLNGKKKCYPIEANVNFNDMATTVITVLNFKSYRYSKKKKKRLRIGCDKFFGFYVCLCI